MVNVNTVQLCSLVIYVTSQPTLGFKDLLLSIESFYISSKSTFVFILLGTECQSTQSWPLPYLIAPTPGSMYFPADFQQDDESNCYDIDSRDVAISDTHTHHIFHYINSRNYNL